MNEHDLWVFTATYIYGPFVGALILLIRTFWIFRKADVERAEKMNSQIKTQIKENKIELNRTINDKFNLLIDHSNTHNVLLASINETLTNERIKTAEDSQRLSAIENNCNRRKDDRQ